MTNLSRKDWILLVLLTLCWGINWPIMKMGVRDFPPISFRTISMLGGLPVIWLAARLQGASLAIPRGKMGAVLGLAIPNMLVWHVFMILAVKMLSSGRAAILGYTMPVWAVLCGLVFFRERPTPAAWIGIGCALAGALLLLSSEFATLAGNPAGSLLALVAAAGWGYGTVVMKRSSLAMPTISLTFWMLALATAVMAVVSIVLESQHWHVPDGLTAATIIYNAVIIFGFAHVVWFGLARSLPPVASSLSVMMIPVLGVFSGAWLLGETPHWQDYAAMGLILIAMCTVLLKKPQTDPT
jgi:drug/metabolite transporter (DMT)-like permease